MTWARSDTRLYRRTPFRLRRRFDLRRRFGERRYPYVQADTVPPNSA